MNILICDDDKLYIDMIRKYVDITVVMKQLRIMKRLILHFLMLRWTELMELKLANV